MNVYDIKSEKEWQKILDDVREESGMPAALVDKKSVVLQVSGERNPLCSEIRANNESLAFICGQTQQFMTKQARSTRKPVIDACEAGMLKFLVPLFIDTDFMGSITVCGSCIPGEEIETFAIEKSTKMNENEIMPLAKMVPEVDEEKVRGVVQRLFQKIKKDV
jgi:ligand-binding sensor protein